jgi:hypothetical protein
MSESIEQVNLAEDACPVAKLSRSRRSRITDGVNIKT